MLAHIVLKLRVLGYLLVLIVVRQLVREYLLAHIVLKQHVAAIHKIVHIVLVMEKIDMQLVLVTGLVNK